MSETKWMSQGELARHLGVTRTTVKNRHKNKTVFDGMQVERREAVGPETKDGRLFYLYRVAPSTRAVGKMEGQREDAAKREKEADKAWHKAQREKAEAALEEMRAKFVALEQKLDDTRAALLEAQSERNALRDQIEAGMPACVSDLANAVWTACAERTADEMRDGLLLALREFTEAT